MMHEDCYDYFIKFNEEKNNRLLCPMCRAPVQKEKTTKKLLQAKTTPEDDPFDLDNG